MLPQLMSIYGGAEGEGGMAAPGGAPKTGGIVADIKQGLSSADAFKQSKPAQGAVASVVAVLCLTIWLNYTPGGAAELAAMGMGGDSRALLASACTTARSEASVFTGEASNQDIPVCQCVMDIDALTAVQAGRKTTITVPPGPDIAGNPIHVSFTGASDENDWIGIYKEGAVPAADGSHDWKYHNGGDTGGAGTVDLSVAAPGNYWITMLCCGGYVELSPRVLITVSPHPLTMTVYPAPGYTNTYVANTAIAVQFSGATQEKDWVGMYELGDVPGDVGSHDWSYHESEHGSGSVQLTPTHPGDYYLVMLTGSDANPYVEASPRVPIQVTCALNMVPCDEAPASCYTQCRQ